MTIYPGDVAPVFSLPDAQGNVVSLADFRGRRVVLYFDQEFLDGTRHVIYPWNQSKASQI